MSSLKIKVPVNKARKNSQQPEQSTSRKKRRVLTDREDDEDGDDRSNSKSATPDAMQEFASPTERQSQPPDAENLFDDDEDIDVVRLAENVKEKPKRARSSSQTQKKNKKKASVVYSDEEGDYSEARGKGSRQDKDEDFVSDSPPPRKANRKGTGGVKGRGKTTKERGGGVGEIVMKDERKLHVPTTVDTKGSAKRRRGTLSETSGDIAVDNEAPSGASTSTSVAPAASQAQSQEDQPPPSKMRKLPTIKKIKALATSTAQSPGPSTPSAKAGGAPSAGSSNASATPEGLPIHVSLPRKPVAPVQKTTDVDLNNKDIYESMFSKAGSSMPRAGINPRVKEDERRKELMKMRDEARATRMVELQKNSFDLLAGQETVARFEAKLRQRNSPALFPNHLASAIKYISLKKDAGQG